MDFHLRQIMNDHLAPTERAEISLQYRKAKAYMSENALTEVNKRISGLHASLSNQSIELAMDQSSRTAWEELLHPMLIIYPSQCQAWGSRLQSKFLLL